MPETTRNQTQQITSKRNGTLRICVSCASFSPDLAREKTEEEKSIRERGQNDAQDAQDTQNVKPIVPPPTRPRPPARYATSDTDRKPLYTPADDPLPFANDVRHAALDVMILAYAARRHAEWLASIGPCQPDVAELIAKDLDAIGRAIAGDSGGAGCDGAAPDATKVLPRNGMNRDAHGNSRGDGLTLFTARTQNHED